MSELLGASVMISAVLRGVYERSLKDKLDKLYSCTMNVCEQNAHLEETTQYMLHRARRTKNLHDWRITTYAKPRPSERACGLRQLQGSCCPAFTPTHLQTIRPKSKHKFTSCLAEDIFPSVNLYDSVLHRTLPLILVPYHLHIPTLNTTAATVPCQLLYQSQNRS